MLTSKSLQYTTGMGFVCGPNGGLLVVQPFSQMWTGPPDSTYLRRACHTCHCANLAPDDPEPPAVERPACVVDVGEDEVVGPVPSYPPNPQCKTVTTASGRVIEDDPSLHDEHRCNEYMYGRPIYADCDVAHDELQKYEDAWRAAQPLDEETDPAIFVGIGRMADYERDHSPMGGENPDLTQLPVTQTNGTSPGLVTSLNI